MDRILVLRKISQLDEYIEQLNEYKDVTTSEYLTNWRTQRIVERTLQMMIEICADVAAHIISDESFRTPGSYAEAFEILGEGGVTPPALSLKLQNMARFRNLVVHGYDKIDANVVIEILRNDLGDFGEFRDSVLTFLKR